MISLLETQLNEQKSKNDELQKQVQDQEDQLQARQVEMTSMRMQLDENLNVVVTYKDQVEQL